jgi:diaminopropionate ammonia-lyase
MQRLYFPAVGDPRIISGEAGAAGLAGLIALCRATEFADALKRLGVSSCTSVLVVNSEGDTDPVNFAKVTGSQPGARGIID